MAVPLTVRYLSRVTLEVAVSLARRWYERTAAAL